VVLSCGRKEENGSWRKLEREFMYYPHAGYRKI
jgi:hypothetical protein